MLLRLDPAHAPVWVSPTRMRFGVERAIVELDPVDRAVELLVTALRHGARREALVVVGGEAGLDERAVLDLLERLAPVIEQPSEVPPPFRVALERTEAWPRDDAGVGRLLGESVQRSGNLLVERDDRVDLAILVAPHAPPATLAAHWLSRDIPHLPILVGPDGITIGPLVHPGRSACLVCVESHRIDHDPDRPTVLAQVASPRRASDLAVPPLAALVTATELALFLTALAAGERGEGGAWSSVERDGSIRRGRWLPHPRCSCRGLRGTANAVVRSIDEVRRAPRTS